MGGKGRPWTLKQVQDDEAKKSSDGPKSNRLVAKRPVANAYSARVGTPSINWCSSPASHISIMMSLPPTNSPFT